MLVVLNLFKILFFLFFIIEVFPCTHVWGDLKSKNNCQFTTKNDGNPFQIRFVTKNNDINKFNPRFVFKIDEIKKLDGLKFIFKFEGQVVGEYEVPLYSDFDYGFIKNNYPTDLTIPKSSLNKFNNVSKYIDMIEVYIAPKKNYELNIQFTKLSFDKKNSRGKVSITFDDGYRSNLVASRLTKKYGLNATAFIIPEVIGEQSYLTKNDIQSLKRNGWFISSHEFKPVTEVSETKLKSYFLRSKRSTHELANHQSAQHFAYPMGKTSPKAIEQAKSVFKSARIAGGGIETLPVGDLYRVRVINVLPNLAPEKLFEICKKAILNGDWAVLMFHYLDEESKTDLNYSSKNLDKFLKMLSVFKKDVMPYHEVI